MADIFLDNKKFQSDGTALINVLRQNGIFIDAPCGGTGHCGKCKIKVTGKVSPVTSEEKALLTASELKSGIRLACLCKAEGDVTAEILSKEKIDAVTEFKTKNFTAENNYKPGEYGVAVDIGTTTVAAYFFELKSGRLITVKSGMNMQREYGADVISRISACDSDSTALKKQGDLISGQINLMIKEFGKPVKTAVIAGNTTMLHLLALLNPSGIARSPFTPMSLFGTEYSGGQLGLDINESVYLTPCVSAYVGGDITAGLVGADIDVSNENILYIDIGTNGEMALCSGGTIYCCSTAAGPAFEGAKIKYGTGSVPGAVNRVWYDKGIKYTAINDIEPVGICGSGLIDAVSTMLQIGVVDETGRLLDDDEAGPEYAALLTDEGFKIADNVYITKKDVREVQLAKSAIAAGIETLLEYSGCKANDISKAVIAGGFGAHINTKSAMNIGLLPKELEGKYEAIGNGAGQGASAVLLNDRIKERTDKISDMCKYIELSGNAFFNDRYIENMMFE